MLLTRGRMLRGIQRSVLTANQREWYSRGVTRRNLSRPMNLLRLTLIDPAGGVSFVAHGEALPALLKACATDPKSIDELLERVEPYYHGLRERVENGIVMFDERNADGNN